MKLPYWIQSLSNLFYPNLCVACGEVLAEGESQVCTFCRWDIPLTNFHLLKENYVVELFAARFPFVNACSLFHFRGGDDKFRHMIHRMKYSSRRDIAYLMGEIMGETLRESQLYDDIDTLVPIPLHWTKRLIRGYNQSEEICRGMSASMGIPCDFKTVRRVKITSQQARRHRRERWKNVANAFRVTNTATLRNRHVLLVDDVLTTGSTIESCASEITTRIEGVRLSVATLAVAKLSRQARTNHIAESTDV